MVAVTVERACGARIISCRLTRVQADTSFAVRPGANWNLRSRICAAAE
jgi:hypothetical protein